jgi:hypothetical protein
MSKQPVFLSALYSICQLGLGLLLHPYQTMQSIVQDKLFVWMTLFPSAILAVVTLLWRFVIVPTVRMIFSCKTSFGAECAFLPFISNWLTFFCIYWQIILFYLLVRFTVVFNKTARKYDA